VCVEMDQLFPLVLEPRDALERMLLARFDQVCQPYKK